MQTIRTWAAIKNRDLFTIPGLESRDWSEEWPDLTSVTRKTNLIISI